MLTVEQTNAQILALDPFQRATRESASVALKVAASSPARTREDYIKLERLHTECVQAKDYTAARACVLLFWGFGS